MGGLPTETSKSQQVTEKSHSTTPNHAEEDKSPGIGTVGWGQEKKRRLRESRPVTAALPLKSNHVEKILANNPDNFPRKIAVGVDLSDFEQLRVSLENRSQQKLLAENKKRAKSSYHNKATSSSN